MATVSLLPLLIAASIAATPLRGPAPQDARIVALANAVNATAAVEWRAAFRAEGQTYAPPRILFVHAPLGHPVRGTGYSSGIVVIDLDDMQQISELAGPDATAMTTLIVAHEIGHHVQFLTRQGKGQRIAITSGKPREL